MIASLGIKGALVARAVVSTIMSMERVVVAITESYCWGRAE